LILTAVIAAALPSRAGLKALLEATEQVEVVTEAVSVASLDMDATRADVLVIMENPDDSIDWLVDLPEGRQMPGVLLLSDDPQYMQILGKLPLPAWGILPTDFSETELISALYSVATGLIVIAPSLLQKTNTPLTSQNSSQPDSSTSLTTRELQVLTLLSDGLANKQISIELGISEHTVKFHVSSIYQKLNVSNRAEAVRLGIQLGLILV